MDPAHNTESEIDRLKLRFEPWLCDKDKYGFRQFMGTTTAVIRSLKYGNEVEDYLDVKLERVIFQPMMISSVITEDPDFQQPTVDRIGDDLDDVPDPQTVTRTLFGNTSPTTVRSMSSLRNAANTTATLKTAGSYYSLSKGALSLDKMLYSILKGLVKGSMSVILECTLEQSYIQGMCLLHKQCDIIKNDRIARAFQAVDSLKFENDAQVWATTCMTSIRELFASRATITHYCMKSLMQSLDGKCKTAQFRIAEDMNALGHDEEVNIFDLIQTYATMMASVGNGSNSKILAIEDDECHYCHEIGHHANNCPKKKADHAAGGTSGKGGKKISKWKRVCTYCGMKGHLEDVCRHKKKDTADAALMVKDQDANTQAPTPAPAEAQQPATAPTAASLAAYLASLKTGGAPVQRMISESVPVIRSRYGKRGDAHIGEASHPGPHQRQGAISASNRKALPVTTWMLVTVACVLSLCDGMGCGLMSLRQNDARFDRYLATEIDKDAKRIAMNANPDIPGLPRMDHSWHSNAYNITEEDIEALGYNSIKLFLAGPPCQDFSKLRLITRKSARKKAAELRPGLNGPNGRMFREVIKILQWVLKYNPDCEFLIECVDFSDMAEDWDEICGALGPPMLINAQWYSFSRRNRAYWSNFVKALNLPAPGPRLDPNTCMIGLRTVVMHESKDGSFMYQIGGTWRGDPQKPYASTARPILVNDPMYEKMQHLFPEEAEALHGMKVGCTSGQGVTNKQRLEAIGRGWDINVTSLLLSFSKLCTNQDTQKATIAIVSMYESMDHLDMAECLMQLTPDERGWYLELLSTHMEQCNMNGEHICTEDANASGNQTAEGRVQHVTDSKSENTISVQGTEIARTNVDQVTPSMDDINQTALRAILAAQEALTDEELALHMMDMEPDIRDWYLSLLASHYENEHGDSSVLDSGSSKHLQRRVCITDNENLTPLAGFNGSIQWTEGNGYVPAHMNDSITGETFKIDMEDVDLMTSDLISNIWSLGKMLKNGWEFHLHNKGKDCYGLTPGGAHRVDINLGLDNILRISHQMRQQRDRVPMPQQPQINTVKKSTGDATASFLHDSFFHRGDEKIYQTLGVTKGFKQVRIQTGHCDSCAKGKAREFGLSQMRHMVAMNESAGNHDPVFDDDNALDPFDSESDDDEFEYVAPVAGRELGTQNVPRFDLATLQPFEAMFVDNKDFPCFVRGGASTCLVFVDYKTRTKHKVDLHTKANNGKAFRQIMAKEGVHKLPYLCRVYTDGCGSMTHVKDMATAMGIDHQFIPPHQQSLNEAEKVCDTIFAETRAVMEHHNAPSSWFSLMVDFAMYTDIRTATTASREWKTPYEMSRGSQPFIGKIHRPCTRCFVQVPKSKRKQLANRGLQNLRAEPGRLVGYHGPYSSTYAVMLDAQYSGQQDRLVHSRNVTFNDADYLIPQQGKKVTFNDHSTYLDARPAAPEEAIAENCESEPEAPRPVPDRDEHFEEYFDANDPTNQPWFTHADSPQQRPRPSYHKMCNVMKEQAITCMVIDHSTCTDEKCNTALHKECMHVLSTANPRHSAFKNLAMVLAAHAHNDMDWGKALKSDDRDKVIAALYNEMESLQSTILEKIESSDEEYQIACELATPGRLLLSIKRSGMYKARGVKQGFKEDFIQADGPDFNYYAHVAKFNSIRMSTFRLNRGNRRIAIKDVSTAFLQSDKFPDNVIKYICFMDPVTREWDYFKQKGPIYGEKSATRRWEDTIAPWFEDTGFERGMNEPCAFYDELTDALVLLYTDDNFLDGDEEDITDIDGALDDRFQCKDIEWLEEDIDLDYLGMQLFQTSTHTGFCLELYINKTLQILGQNDLSKTADTPINKPIDGDSPKLVDKRLKLFPTAIGCFGWMANTCRPDISYAHSRMSQHLANPTESAWEAVIRCCDYLRGTTDLCIAAPRWQEDKDVLSTGKHIDSNHGWEFYSDSDFAGNSETQNKRRSQSGFIATLNGAPVLWGSKVSSVAFAHPNIEESHADISSGAAEVYAAGNATFEFLHLSYTAEEMGIPFPKPMVMQVDNKAAIAFSDNTAFKSKLKHIDVRQEWVQTLRDKSIIQTEHVKSEDNLADLFTKILSTHIFTKLRDRIMIKRSSI